MFVLSTLVSVQEIWLTNSITKSSVRYPQAKASGNIHVIHPQQNGTLDNLLVYAGNSGRTRFK